MKLDRPADKTGHFRSEKALPALVRAKLSLKDPLTHKTEVFVVDKEVITIGRDPACEVIIQKDACISRHHARISYSEGSFWLEDLGAANGTFLNGFAVITREKLTFGDEIRVGLSDMAFTRA